MHRTGGIGRTSNYTTSPNREMMHAFDDRKKYLKKRSFEIVADQTGKIFDPEVFTLVWARRFAGYKRASLITSDEERFKKLLAQ